MQDFEPYFCIREGCNAPFDVPNTFEGLLSHLKSHVDVKYHVDMPDGEHKTFDEGGFAWHVAQHGNISGEMLATMKEASRRRADFIFESCPFCGGFPDDVEKRFPDRDTRECQRELRKHIKRHMQDVALFFPPFREGIFDEDEDLQNDVASHHRIPRQNRIATAGRLNEFVRAHKRYRDGASSSAFLPDGKWAALSSRRTASLAKWQTKDKDDGLSTEGVERPPTVIAAAESQGSDDPRDRLSLDANIEWENILDHPYVRIAYHLRSAVHGRLSPSSGLASLMLYSFLLQPTMVHRRLTQVEIQLLYSSDANDINVWGIAFNGTFLLSPPTTAKEGKMKIEAEPAVFGADLQRERERDTATVTGSIRIVNRIYGGPDSASWMLMENASVKTGVPTVFDTAVVVTRLDNSPFRCALNVKASVNQRGETSTIRFSNPSEAPAIIHNPLLPLIDSVGNYDAENLSSIDLEKFSSVSNIVE